MKPGNKQGLRNFILNGCMGLTTNTMTFDRTLSASHFAR
jgi:hypothetical protein